ncbi:MAG: hypothetical protein CMM44_00390 [Rhodospirillaceae bacterium]|nr:hypothetical protein [Rhodospirillaceae bacterium]
MDLNFNIIPFQGIEWWVLVCLAVTHAFGCFIRGAFGFGSNVPIVVISAFLLPPHHAVLLALMTTVAAQIQLIPDGFRTADWEVTKPLVAGLIFGTAAGTWLFSILTPEDLVIILGGGVVVIIILDTFRLIERIVKYTNLRSKKLAAILAIISGLIGGLTGAGAFYFLVVYLKHACASPSSLRGTNVILSSITMIIRIVSLSALGFINPKLIIEGLILWPVVLTATWLGSSAFKCSTPKVFYVVLQAILLTGAGALIYRGLVKV